MCNVPRGVLGREERQGRMRREPHVLESGVHNARVAAAAARCLMRRQQLQAARLVAQHGKIVHKGAG